MLFRYICGEELKNCGKSVFPGHCFDDLSASVARIDLFACSYNSRALQLQHVPAYRLRITSQRRRKGGLAEASTVYSKSCIKQAAAQAAIETGEAAIAGAEDT